jgi:hypothetical protein
MFEDVRLRIVGTLAALRRAVVGYVQGRKDDSAPLLIITFRADAVYAGLADLFNGHRCSRRRVTPDRLTSGRSGEFGGYLVTSSDRLDGIDFGPLEVLSYEGEGLQALASLRPLRFVFILLRAVAMSVRDTVAPRFREALCFEQHPCFAAIGAYDRRYVSVLKESRVWEGNLPFPDMRNCPAEIVSATLAQFRQGCESPPCPHCGAVLLRGMPLGFCCRGFQRSILNHLPPPMPMGLVRKIVRATGHSPNFPRTLNASLRPVLQHASVSAPQGGGSTLFITGIPYAVNAMGQFQTTVYAIFCRNEDRDSLRSPEVARLIDEMLTLNPTLRQYVRDRVDAVRRAAQVTIPDLDEGFNFAILAEGSTRLVPSELQAIDVEYGREKLSQWQMLYDQLVYPAIFWAGTGGCGVSAGDRLQGATTRIRKVAIALILQGREHFIHQMPTLREEFVCAISGRLINLNIKYLAQTERTFAQEDELQADAGDQEPKEYGLRTFIPPSLTDSDEYWHDVATRCFAISAKFGAPTFFLTFTMNPYWPEYQALKRESGNFGDSAIMAIVFKEKLSALMTFLKKRRTLGTILAFVWRIEYQRRGLPHAHLLFWTDFETQIVESVDSVINVRYPKVSPFLNDGEQVADLRVLIESYQKHHHSRRCGVPPGPCRFGYPQRPAPHTTIRRLRYCFARDADGGDIVPHNPLVLAHFRCHHCLEVIHSDQAIGYVLKYCTKNSDAGHVHLRRVLYEGHVVTPDNRLEYYAATRIASAPEAFAGICGFWRHHMKPTVRSLGIHLPGKKIVMRSGRGDPAVQVDVPSALERYLGRPLGEQYDLLTYIEYFAEYSVDSKQRSGDSDGDQCQPAYYANRLQRPILCMLHSVHPRERERFALRLLLRNFAARSWEELRTRNGRRWDTFYEAAHESGLVSDRDDEAVICMQDAVDMRRPPSDVRFLLVQMIAFGASRERLLVMFRNHLADLGDSDADINGKIDVLIAAQREPWGSHATDDNVLADMDEATAWGRLTVEQNAIAGEIVSAVLSDGPNLMFLQGSAGTGKTFTVSTIIEILRSRGKRCLICATTGVAAMQYHGGATLHSLFRLGIDEESRGGFTCNIGRGTAHGKYLLEADLIVIDEISMLTPWVAQRVSLTLQWVTESRIDFGGKKLLFVGDFLQLPPVIANSHMPVVQRLITRLPCWGSIHKLRLERPMRAPDPEWTRLLSHVARGERDHLPDWFGLQEFGVTITQDLNEVLAFFAKDWLDISVSRWIVNGSPPRIDLRMTLTCESKIGAAGRVQSFWGAQERVPN